MFGEIIVARIFNIFRFVVLFSFPLLLCVAVIGEATNSVLQDISCEMYRSICPYQVSEDGSFIT